MSKPGARAWDSHLRAAMSRRALGVDIGRVLAAEDLDKNVSLLSANWRQTETVAGSVEALGRLSTRAAFPGGIYLVSKCGPVVEERTREWLYMNRVLQRAGVDESRVHFVRERQQKAAICESYSITHFVDDRLSNLSWMINVPNRYLFVPEKPSNFPRWATWAKDWKMLEMFLVRHEV